MAMNQFAFEIVGSISWQKAQLQDSVLYASRQGPGGKPLMIARVPPDFSRGPDGTLWLTARNRAIRLHDTHVTDSLPLTAAGVDKLIAIGPTRDKGGVLLGQKDAKNVLAHLTARGELLWRRTDLSVLVGHLTQAQLLVDFDGDIYLYTVCRGQGQVAQVDLATQTVTTRFNFKNSPPLKVWLQHKSLYWVAYEGGTLIWVCQNLETGQQHILDQPPLPRLFESAASPLLDGGVLLAIAHQGELVWMGSEGVEFGRLGLAGVVRDGEAVVIGSRDNNLIRVSRWLAGQAIDSFQTGPLGEKARLIGIHQNKYYFRVAKKLVVTDSMGNRIDEIVPLQLAELIQQKEGNIPFSKVLIEPTGSVLLAGADGEGTYILRIVHEIV